MGGAQPYAYVDLKDWLLPGITDPSEAPDILVVGIQEIIPNKGSGYFRQKNKDRLTFMQNNIMSVLNTNMI